VIPDPIDPSPRRERLRVPGHHRFPGATYNYWIEDEGAVCRALTASRPVRAPFTPVGATIPSPPPRAFVVPSSIGESDLAVYDLSGRLV
jgi:hypothetical protein